MAMVAVIVLVAMVTDGVVMAIVVVVVGLVGGGGGCHHQCCGGSVSQSEVLNWFYNSNTTPKDKERVVVCLRGTGQELH